MNNEEELDDYEHMFSRRGVYDHEKLRSAGR
jgi:hypothetical protein